jgi:hypothetical protein
LYRGVVKIYKILKKINNNWELTINKLDYKKALTLSPRSLYPELVRV